VISIWECFYAGSDDDDDDLDSAPLDTFASSNKAIRTKFLNPVAELCLVRKAGTMSRRSRFDRGRTLLKSMWPEILTSLTRSHTGSRGAAAVDPVFESGFKRRVTGSSIPLRIDK
jgi:hypothetical protein